MTPRCQEEIDYREKIAGDDERAEEAFQERQQQCLECRGDGWCIEPNPGTGEPEQVQCPVCCGTGKRET